MGNMEQALFLRTIQSLQRMSSQLDEELERVRRGISHINYARRIRALDLTRKSGEPLDLKIEGWRTNVPGLCAIIGVEGWDEFGEEIVAISNQLVESPKYITAGESWIACWDVSTPDDPDYKSFTLTINGIGSGDPTKEMLEQTHRKAMELVGNDPFPPRRDIDEMGGGGNG